MFQIYTDDLDKPKMYAITAVLTCESELRFGIWFGFLINSDLLCHSP